SMMVDLKVMAYFKISLSTRNWDRAIFLASIEYELRLSAQRQGGAFHPRISGVPDRPPLV
ncbi:hypothetical protein ACET89_20675, partial [Aeromonas veronii]